MGSQSSWDSLLLVCLYLLSTHTSYNVLPAYCQFPQTWGLARLKTDSETLGFAPNWSASKWSHKLHLCDCNTFHHGTANGLPELQFSKETNPGPILSIKGWTNNLANCKAREGLLSEHRHLAVGIAGGFVVLFLAFDSYTCYVTLPDSNLWFSCHSSLSTGCRWMGEKQETATQAGQHLKW